MAVLKTLHVLGAILMVGGVTAQLLLRPLTTHAGQEARQSLYSLAWRLQVLMVYAGSGLLLITGILLWLGGFSLFTGWLLLGFLLYIAAAGLDGAFLSPNLRRTRAGLKRGPVNAVADPGATTIQLVTWFLLVVVVFLMTARPF